MRKFFSITDNAIDLTSYLIANDEAEARDAYFAQQSRSWDMLIDALNANLIVTELCAAKDIRAWRNRELERERAARGH